MLAKVLFQIKIGVMVGLFALIGLAAGAQDIVLQFDSTGQLKSYPPCYAFPRDQHVVVNLAGDVVVLMKIRKKIADQLQALSDSVNVQIAKREVADFYKRLWGEVKFNAFVIEAGKWNVYLNTAVADTISPDPVYTFFPIVPSMTTLRSKGFQAIATEGKPPKTDGLNTGFFGSDWILHGKHPEFSFFFQENDVFRLAQIDAFNKQRPGEFKDISRAKLNNWLAELRDIRKDSLTVVSRLNDPLYKIIDPACDSNQGLVNKIAADTKKSALYKLFNQDFFIKWLWFNGGKLQLNPFSFTTPDRLEVLTSRQVLDKIALFNKLYAEKLNCDVCKLYPDSLVIIINGQKTGNLLFLEDSLKQDKKNKRLLDVFETNSTRLNRFSYPVLRHDDDDPDDPDAMLIHQYDASTHFRRLHRMLDDIDFNYIPRKKDRREAENNIPDNTAAAVAIHNIPSAKQVSVIVSEVDLKDRSKAEIFTDSLISTTASLYSLLNPAAAAMTGLTAIFNSPVKINPTNIQPGSATVTNGPANIISIDKQKETKITTQSFNIKIDNSYINVSVAEQTGAILDCRLLKAKIISIILADQHVRCITDMEAQSKLLADAFKGGSDICTYKGRNSYEDSVKMYVKNFQAYLARKIDTVKLNLMAELVDNSRLYNYLMLRMEDIAGAPLPPDQLESKLVSDTPLYSTQVKYLDPTKVPVTEQYQVNVKSGKDSVVVAKGAVNIAKTHFFQLGAGLVFSVNKPDLVTVTGSGSTLNIARDANFAQFVAGIHLYIPGFGLYNLDNRFIIHAGRGKTYRKQIGLSDLNRLSLFLGVGIPQPLKNYYTGISADLWPGIRLHTGLHWLWFTKYQIVNNQITDQHSALDKASLYIGLNIDPTSLVNLLNIFKKQ